MSGNNNRKKLAQSKSNKKENDHLPRYIKSQPWYYKDESKNGAKSSTSEETEDSDYLLHHRRNKKLKGLDLENNAEPKVGLGINDEVEEVVSYHSGALEAANTKKAKVCQNCKLSGHMQKDCLERPRKKRSRSKVVGDGLSDEIKEGNKNIIKIRKDAENQDYDARKDRWFGYTGKEYDQVLKQWREISSTGHNDQQTQWDTDEEIEMIKLGIHEESIGNFKPSNSGNPNSLRSSVRLREDKANYLQDINSFEMKYDPKSRIYKSESVGTVDEKSKMFRRHLVGEAQELNELNKFAREHAGNSGIKDEVESSEKVQHVLIANPTKYEQLIKQKKQEVQKSNDRTIKQVQYKDLQAKKIQGTPQSKKSSKFLKDMYG